jgi:hypothetical protein
MNQSDMVDIGDGVFIGYDGTQVWLTVAKPEPPDLLSLDPEMIKNLVQIAERYTGVKK